MRSGLEIHILKSSVNIQLDVQNSPGGLSSVVFKSGYCTKFTR